MKLLRDEDAQLWREVGRLTSEVGSVETLRNELEVSVRRLAARNARIDRLGVVLILVCDTIDHGLAGPGDQS